MKIIFPGRFYSPPKEKTGNNKRYKYLFKKQILIPVPAGRG
jgi:hypothetical protein